MVPMQWMKMRIQDGQVIKEGDQGYIMIVDLEKLYEIEKVNIMFEKAYPNDFQILVSKDKTNWTVARTVRGFKTTEVDKKVYESDGVCLRKSKICKSTMS